MKTLLAIMLIIPSLAFGQTQPAPDPHTQAMARALMEAVGREVAAMARVIALEAQLAKLNPPATEPK